MSLAEGLAFSPASPPFRRLCASRCKFAAVIGKGFDLFSKRRGRIDGAQRRRVRCLARSADGHGAPCGYERFIGLPLLEQHLREVVPCIAGLRMIDGGLSVLRCCCFEMALSVGSIAKGQTCEQA